MQGLVEAPELVEVGIQVEDKLGVVEVEVEVVGNKVEGNMEVVVEEVGNLGEAAVGVAVKMRDQY